MNPRNFFGTGRPAYIFLSVVCLFIGSGCATTKKTEPKKAIAAHPFGEQRMSIGPAEGYKPTCVFRIQGARNTVFLAGTRHVVSAQEIPFPSSFYAAYAQASEIYVEIDSSDLSIFATARLTMPLLKWYWAHSADLVCPKGRTLSDYVSAKTLEKVRKASGKDYSKSRLTPLALLLVNEGGQAQDTGPIGVDEVFAVQARKDHKTIRELDDGPIAETAILLLEEMLSTWRRAIARQGADSVIEKHMVKAPAEDRRGWRFGDMKAVEQAQAEIQHESPTLYEKGVVERNAKWMPKLLKVLQQEKDAFVLVGVDHLAGPDGLLQALTKAGFQVEQMYGIDRPGMLPR